MPRGARGQLVPLNQNDICPTLLSEVVERGTPCDATADDDYFGARFHGVILLCAFG